MPLKRGSTDKIISENIRQLVHEGYPLRQAIAIAYRSAGRSRAVAGSGTRAKRQARRSGATRR